MIKRNFWFCPQKVKESVYMSIVRPRLEYASSAWDPHTQKDKYNIERVQRKAARFCLRNYNPTESVTGMLENFWLGYIRNQKKESGINYDVQNVS